jgi:hypothetical protein
MPDVIMNTPATFELILAAEVRLNLPPLFYVDLLKQGDDWTFIVKFNSLFEGFLSKLVEYALSSPQTHKLATPLLAARFNPQKERYEPTEYAYWDESYKQCMKLANELALFPNPYIIFTEQLYHIRKACVHDLKCIASPLKQYISDLDIARRSELEQSIAFALPNISEAEFAKYAAMVPCPFDTSDDPRGARVRLDMEQFFRKCRENFISNAPRTSIWFAGAITLGHLSTELYKARDHTRDVQCLDAALQDIHQDRKVLEFKRKFSENYPVIPSEDISKRLCLMLALEEMLLPDHHY